MFNSKPTFARCAVLRQKKAACEKKKNKKKGACATLALLPRAGRAAAAAAHDYATLLWNKATTADVMTKEKR